MATFKEKVKVIYDFKRKMLSKNKDKTNERWSLMGEDVERGRNREHWAMYLYHLEGFLIFFYFRRFVQ